MKALIDDASAFIDGLVSLIPAKFYLPIPDADERPWFQGLSKTAKASLKKQSRENLKKARRQRFNPDTPSSTLDALQKSIDQNQKDSDDDDDDEENPKPNPKREEKSVTYEELRQRLHRRIEELRSGRNTRPKNEPRSDRQKRKREEAEEKSEERKEEKQKVESLAAAAEGDITFGVVKVGDEDGRRKKKKISKARELEKAKKLEELKKDPEKGEKVAKKHSWKAAESRAMGVKVHDDPKLLKESIKKEKKRQKKHAEKWKDRVETRENARKEKQKMRTDNIRERIHQKKMRKIEKREKKLMRPGFEGRKEGYINE